MPKIYKLWIFQRESGLNLVDAEIEAFEGANPVDANLLSGLLTSFLTFTQEIMGEEIQIVETKSYRLVFSPKEDIVVVIMMDRFGSPHFAQKILDRVNKHFTKEYREQIELSFKGDVTAFAKITETIEEVTSKKGIKLIREMARRQRERQAEEIQESVHNLIHSLKKG